MEIQYIYLLQTREYVNSGEPIYKVGKTKQINYSRFLQYPNGSIQLFQCICNNCDILEKKVIKLFQKKYINHKIAGREYFRGELCLMINDLFNIISNEKAKTLPIESIAVKENAVGEIAVDENADDENAISEKNTVKEILDVEIAVEEIKPECTNKTEMLKGKFVCQICKFSTRSQFCLNVHYNTKKHKKNINPLSSDSKKNYNCKICNNGYNFASGLYGHVRKCHSIRTETKVERNNFIIFDELKKINDRLSMISFK